MTKYKCKGCTFDSCTLENNDLNDITPFYCPYSPVILKSRWEKVETNNINKELDTIKRFAQRGKTLRERDLWAAIKEIYRKLGKEWSGLVENEKV